MDRLCDRNEWQIKELEVVVMPDGSDSNRFQRCACVRGTSLGVLSAGRITIMGVGLVGCRGGPVGGSDWLSVRGVVVVCPGGVRIVYIRRALTGSSSLDAAPVTGSLVFSAPVYCLAVYRAAGFYSWLIFGGTDCVWLAGCGLFFRRVRATDGAAVVEGQAGITLS